MDDNINIYIEREKEVEKERGREAVNKSVETEGILVKFVQNGQVVQNSSA